MIRDSYPYNDKEFMNNREEEMCCRGRYVIDIEKDRYSYKDKRLYMNSGERDVLMVAWIGGLYEPIKSWIFLFFLLINANISSLNREKARIYIFDTTIMNYVFNH